MPDSSEPFPHPHPDPPPASTPGAHRPHWPLRPSTPTPGPVGPPYALWDPRHARWRNAALRIDGRTVIHAIRRAATDQGGQRVAPACHTGHDRSDDSRTLQPVYTQSVSCKDCLRTTVARDEGRSYDPNLNQFDGQDPLPGMPRLPSFPPFDDAESAP